MDEKVPGCSRQKKLASELCILPQVPEAHNVFKRAFELPQSHEHCLPRSIIQSNRRCIASSGQRRVVFQLNWKVLSWNCSPEFPAYSASKGTPSPPARQDGSGATCTAAMDEKLLIKPCCAFWSVHFRGTVVPSLKTLLVETGLKNPLNR